MDAATRYVEHVDRVLAAACALLPSEDSEDHDLQGPPRPAQAPGGRSSLSSSAAGAAERYQTAGQAVDSTHTGAARAAREALEAAREAGRTAEGLRNAAKAQAAALLPAANTPAGLRTLVDTMGSALTAMQSHLSTTRAQMSAAAEELRRHRDDWRGVLEA